MDTILGKLHIIILPLTSTYLHLFHNFPFMCDLIKWKKEMWHSSLKDPLCLKVQHLFRRIFKRFILISIWVYSTIFKIGGIFVVTFINPHWKLTRSWLKLKIIYTLWLLWRKELGFLVNKNVLLSLKLIKMNKSLKIRSLKCSMKSTY